MSYTAPGRVEFTKEMRESYTILVPDMLPTHFAMLEPILTNEGYNVVILKNDGRAVVDMGLKYVHNDTCYPALLVIGQMMDALHSGAYDLDKVALLITQTCGGCRASNYLHLLRKALVKAGMEQIPVLSLNMNGIEKNSGFEITISLLRKAMAALAYGDLLMLLANQTRPYEVVPGSTDALVHNWQQHFVALFAKGEGYNKKAMRANFADVVKSFAALEIEVVPRVKVGIVGEIYVKYSTLGNNGLEAFLASQGCEVMVPGMMEFIIYTMDAPERDIELYGGSFFKRKMYTFAKKYLCGIKDAAADAVRQNSNFVPATTFEHMKQGALKVVDTGNKMGEGWLLPGEMMELAELGYGNIVCVQPFGCLPNHIIGKGMVRSIKDIYPTSNIVPIDYDPGATRVNQENRIKLMLAVAQEELDAASAKKLEEQNAKAAEVTA